MRKPLFSLFESLSNSKKQVYITSKYVLIHQNKFLFNDKYFHYITHTHFYFTKEIFSNSIKIYRFTFFYFNFIALSLFKKNCKLIL